MVELDRLQMEVARAKRVAVLLNDAQSRATLESYVRELERRAAASGLDLAPGQDVAI